MHFRRSSPLLRVGACCRLRRPGASLLRAPGTAAARTLAATSSSAAEESTTTRRIGALFFSGLCGVTGCLTAWQLSRYDWKLRLIDEREKSLRDAPVPLRSLVPELADGCSEDAEFRALLAKVVFDHEAGAWGLGARPRAAVRAATRQRARSCPQAGTCSRRRAAPMVRASSSTEVGVAR